MLLSKVPLLPLEEVQTPVLVVPPLTAPVIETLEVLAQMVCGAPASTKIPGPISSNIVSVAAAQAPLLVEVSTIITLPAVVSPWPAV